MTTDERSLRRRTQAPSAPATDARAAEEPAEMDARATDARPTDEPAKTGARAADEPVTTDALTTETRAAARRPVGRPRLPADDVALWDLDLSGLTAHWEATAARAPMTAQEMTGADAKAQRLGVKGIRLMEQAGTAVAAAVRSLAVTAERWGTGPILVLCGPGNNGGDGFVAARRLADHGARVVVVLVGTDGRPRTPDAARNWDRLAAKPSVERIHAPVARDVQVIGQGVERAALVVDALLGTGVTGFLREPVKSAVEVCQRARTAGVPILSVDTPTACDLTSGELSDPVVQAHVTVTFHRPKTGLRTKRGQAVAGRVLVAPIGIPANADRS